MSKKLSIYAESLLIGYEFEAGMAGKYGMMIPGTGQYKQDLTQYITRLENRFIEHSPEEKPGHGIDVLLEVETIGFVVGFCINGDYRDDYWVQRGWEGVTELSENVGEKVLRWFELPEDKGANKN